MKLAPDSPIDLQIHTIYSDGTWHPERLIDHLLQEGFGTAAITDHDRVDAVDLLQQIARDKGFPLLPAVEMSCQWHENPVDVLCFGFDQRSEALRAVTDHLRHQQQANILQTVHVIGQQGYPLPNDEVQKIVEQPSVQQPHSLVNLVRDHGFERGGQSAGRLLLDAGLQIITVDIALVVSAVHQCGGVCLIAHPGRGEGYVQFDERLLDQLRAEVPIDGIEVLYPKHSPEQIALYQSYAAKYHLLVSAGSDSHTAEVPPIKYPAASSRELLERLSITVL